MKVTYYTDPGHGWIAVTKDQLEEVQIDPSEFSSYSYIDGDTYYLEEDRDASIFMHRLESLGQVPLIQYIYEDHKDSFIRDLPSLR